MQATRSKTITRAATPTRSAAAPAVVASRAAAAVGAQCTAQRVSSPHDPEEREAEATASRILRSLSPAARLVHAPATDAAPIQRAARLEEEPPIARASLLEERPLARSEDGAGAADDGGVATDEVSSEIEAAGSGSALDSSVRRQLEPGFGADFSGVGVHTDARAARLSEQLGARAFTVGQQVFFGRGQFQPHTDEGRHLLAHELTHTLQQRGGLRGKLWRAAKKPAPKKPTLPAKPVGKLKTGLLDPKARTVTFDLLPIPGFKNKAHRGQLYAATKLRRRKGATVSREGTQQRKNWEDDLLSAVRARVEKLGEAHRKGQGADAGTPLVYEVAASGGSGDRYFFGGPTTIARRLTRPDWYLVQGLARDRAYEVDHIVEWQLGGIDDPTNYELLDASTNGSSGNAIKNSIQARVDAFVKATGGALGYDGEAVKTGFDLVFQGVSPTLNPKQIAATMFWTRDQIRGLQHLRGLKVVEPSEIGGKTFVRLFGSPGGGSSRKYSWSVHDERGGTEKPTQGAERSWLSPWVITHKRFRSEGPAKAGGGRGELPESFGMLRVHLPKGDPVFLPVAPRNIPLDRAVAEAPRAGRLVPSRIALGLQARYFSPVELPELEADGVSGLVGQGRILPDLSLLRGLELGLRMHAGETRVFAAFDATRFASQLPAPLRVTEGAVELFYSTRKGWGAEGRLGLAIDRVGSGSVSAGMSSRGGFRLAGDFSFDTTLFDPARVAFVYERGQWSAEGTIGLPPKRIPGVQGGNLTVRYANDQFSVLGSFLVEVPKLAKGELQVSWSQSQGLRIVGENIQLSANIPRVREASGRFSLQQRQGEPGWKLAAALKARIAIPGFESFELSGAYDDGLYEASIDTTIQRGPATIQALVGFTNSPVGVGGLPMAGAPLEQPIFFGRGLATVRMHGMQGSAAIDVSREGVIRVEGRLEVPNDLVVIPDSATPSFDREMLPFKGISMFLFGIPGVASLSATLNGGLRAKANIGAGVIRGAYLSVNYTLGEEDSLRISGGFLFYMPAEASIAGSIAVGLRARVLVFVLGGTIQLTVGGGIRADLSIPVNGSWDRRRGFAIETKIQITGRPFVFIDVGGSIYFDLDLWLASWTLHRKPFNLFHKELGSDLALRVSVPIAWSREKGLDFSWDKVDIGFPSEAEAKSGLSQFGSKLVGPEVEAADRKR